MSDAPERIWLQDAGDYAAAEKLEVTWCVNPVDDADTEYIRADIHAAALDREAARVAKVTAQRDELHDQVRDMLAEQECACGYDHPADVCLGHLPLHRKIVARAEAAEARVAALETEALAMVAAAYLEAAEAFSSWFGGDGGVSFADHIRALAPADALAEVQRLREERDQAIRGRNEWRDDFKALAAAVVGDTGLSAMTVAAQARTFRPRAEQAEAERDTALARVEKLRHQMTEASDPDFIWGAMDNVHDAETTLDDYAAAVSRAIRAALDEETK